MTGGQTRKLAAVLAADIAGYSALMGADESRTVQDLKGHQQAVFPMIAQFGGRIIDTAGDGVLAEFASVVNAVGCALAVQAKMAERNEPVEPERQMRFRIGINLGDVIYDEARLYGDGINIAARLEAMAEPGGICVSSKVYEEISGRVKVACEDLGAQHLKNIARPVRVYRLRAGDPGTAALPPAGSQTSAPSPLSKPALTPKSLDSHSLIQATPAGIRWLVPYTIPPIILLLLAHYLIVLKLDLNPVFLRAFSLLLSVFVGFVLLWQTKRGWGSILLAGAIIGVCSVVGMLVLVGIVDTISIVPSSVLEWQEAAEYAVGITLATVLGAALARVTNSVVWPIRGS